MARKRLAPRSVKQDERLFTLEVCIIGGPMTEKFVKKNKVICRTIQIRGDQTLEALHYAILDAFGYWFDFGDDWWHQINVVAIDDKTPPGKYPKVTERAGENTPQYVDWDEEDEQ